MQPSRRAVWWSHASVLPRHACLMMLVHRSHCFSAVSCACSQMLNDFCLVSSAHKMTQEERWLHHWPALCPWASHSTSLCFCFSSCPFVCLGYLDCKFFKAGTVSYHVFVQHQAQRDPLSVGASRCYWNINNNNKPKLKTLVQILPSVTFMQPCCLQCLFLVFDYWAKSLNSYSVFIQSKLFIKVIVSKPDW